MGVGAAVHMNSAARHAPNEHKFVEEDGGPAAFRIWLGVKQAEGNERATIHRPAPASP